MKLFLIIILIFLIMLIALRVSEQIRDKFDFYKNLKNFLNHFKLNLSFKQDKIVDFLNQTQSKKQFKIFINEYKKYLCSNQLNFQDIKVLESEEKEQLSTIVKNIGHLDAQNEIMQIDNFILEIDEKLKHAEEEKNKLCPMIIKLSFLFAIGLVIILI